MLETRVDKTFEKPAPVLADRRNDSFEQGHRCDEIVGALRAVIVLIEYLRRTLSSALPILVKIYSPDGGASTSPNDAVDELVEWQRQLHFGGHMTMPWSLIGPF